MWQFLIASAVLTIALNVGIRVIPGARQWLADRLTGIASPEPDTDERGSEPSVKPRVKVFFPWKAMLIASILLTLLVNALAAFR